MVEVLSPPAQAHDRGAKFTSYRTLPSLREDLLVDPDTRELQLFRRGGQGLFTRHDLSGQPAVTLARLGIRLPGGEIFDGLDPRLQASLPGLCATHQRRSAPGLPRQPVV